MLATLRSLLSRLASLLSWLLYPFARFADITWPLAPCLVAADVAEKALRTHIHILEKHGVPHLFLVLLYAFGIGFGVVGGVGLALSKVLRFKYTCACFMWPFVGRYRRSHALYQINTLAWMAASTFVLVDNTWGADAAAPVFLLALALGVIGNRTHAAIRACVVPLPRKKTAGA